MNTSMFLSGSLDITDRLRTCPRFDPADSEQVVLEGVELLHVLWEIEDTHMEAILPPALHPSIPPAVSWLVIHCPQSPVGPFILAETRITCRTAIRPRGFLSAAYVTSEAAAGFLAARWGYNATVAEVELEHAYHDASAVVRRGGDPILNVRLLDPTPFDGPVFIHPNLHLVQTADGPSIVEVMGKMAFRRIDRGRPEVLAFDPAAWGEPRLAITTPVAGVTGTGDLTLPAVNVFFDPVAPIER
jgi:hypothetical protein